MIYVLILKYLEGFEPVGPSIHTFKMACLNKKMMQMIMSIYEIKDFKHFAEFETKQKMIRVLESRPDFSKYCANGRSLKAI